MRVARPSIRPSTVVATLVVLALTSAACSGDDDELTAADTITTTDTAAAPSTTPPPATTISPTATPTTTARPTVTEPTTPATSATTVAPESASTTSPMAITDPSNPDVQAAVAAVQTHFAAFDNAMQHPTDAALEQAALATTTGAMSENVAATLARIRELGQESRPNPSEPDRVEVLQELSFIQGDFGGVEACLISPSILVTAGSADDPSAFGPETLKSYLASYSLSRVDDRWVVGDLQITSSFPGQVGCG